MCPRNLLDMIKVISTLIAIVIRLQHFIKATGHSSRLTALLRCARKRAEYILNTQFALNYANFICSHAKGTELFVHAALYTGRYGVSHNLLLAVAMALGARSRRRRFVGVGVAVVVVMASYSLVSTTKQPLKLLSVRYSYKCICIHVCICKCACGIYVLDGSALARTNDDQMYTPSASTSHAVVAQRRWHWCCVVVHIAAMRDDAL